MKKRILISFICLMLAVLLLPFSTLAAGGGLSASKPAVYRGDTFTVTLSVPAMTEKITDASFKVKFDKSVFEVTSYTAPAIAKADKMQSNVSESNANGFFSVTYNSISCDPDVTFGTYTLSCTFKVKSSAAYGKYNFEVSNLSVGSVTDDGMPVSLYTLKDCNNKTVSVTVSEKQTETSKPTESSKPAETSKPTENSKPTESKPTETSKPTESKQTETSKTTVSDNTESETEPTQSTVSSSEKTVTEAATSAEPTESQSTAAESEKTNGEKKNGKSLLWLYILIPVLLILAAAGIYIYIKSHKSKEEK